MLSIITRHGLLTGVLRMGLALLSQKITPVIDRVYSLEQMAEANAYVETGRARGKVVIRLD